MQVIFSNILDTLRRVKGFLEAQAAALGAVIPASLRARLDDAITQLVSFQVEQSAATGVAVGEAVNQADLRKIFRAQFMRPIARIAKASLKNAGEYPTLVVASSRMRKGDFLNAAQALADAAAKHEQAFLGGGMPADFLAQMRLAITQSAASKDAQARSVGRRAAATKGIEDASKTARDVLVVLDAMIEPLLKQNASLLADWKASKKIASVTPLPPQPLGLTATSNPAPAPVPTLVPATPTTAPVDAPAEQAAKAAA